MPKYLPKLLLAFVAMSLVFGAKAFAEEPVKKAVPAKQAKVVETRISEGDMHRLEAMIKQATAAKEGAFGYEYTAKRLKPPKNEKYEKIWNDLGAQGWKVVDHFENIYIFMRPAVASSSYTQHVVDETKAQENIDQQVLEKEKAEAKAQAEAEKAAKKAKLEEEKAAKKAAKEQEKAAKKAEKEAKKAAEEAKKAVEAPKQ